MSKILPLEWNQPNANILLVRSRIHLKFSRSTTIFGVTKVEKENLVRKLMVKPNVRPNYVNIGNFFAVKLSICRKIKTKSGGI